MILMAKKKRERDVLSAGLSSRLEDPLHAVETGNCFTEASPLQYDETRERWVLQAPERVLVLDETGKEIVVLCDGKRSIGDIVDRFVAVYDAPRDIIAHDVGAVIQLLTDKGVLTIEA